MRFNEKEKMILDGLAKADPEGLDVEAIGDLIYRETRRPASWRACVRQTMWLLAIKSSATSRKVVNINPVGRGNSALYKFVEPAKYNCNYGTASQ